MTVTMIMSSSCFFLSRPGEAHEFTGDRQCAVPFKIIDKKKGKNERTMTSCEHKIAKVSFKHHKPVLRIPPRSLEEVQFSYMQGRETVPPCR